MGIESIYYVPLDQQRWAGRGEHAARVLFELGVPADLYRDLYASGLALDWTKLPSCAVDIDQKFAGLFLVDNRHSDLIPNQPEQALCPTCRRDLMLLVYGALNSDVEQDDDQRIVQCESCAHSLPLKSVQFTPHVTFARFYLCVSECEMERWPPEFHTVVEQALGPCTSHKESTT